MTWSLTPESFIPPPMVKRLREVAASLAEDAKRRRLWHPVRNHLMIELGLNTGLRASELADLRVADVILDDDAPAVIVRHGKGDKVRTVRIGQDLKELIRSYLQYREFTGYGRYEWLLPGQRGRWTRHGVGRTFRKLAKAAGLPDRFSAHSMRHTFATELLRVSGSLRLTQKVLGHSSPTTTSIYADIQDDQAIDAANKLFKPKEPPQHK